LLDDINALKSKIKLQNTSVIEHQDWLYMLINILSNSPNVDYTKPIQKVYYFKRKGLENIANLYEENVYLKKNLLNEIKQ